MDIVTLLKMKERTEHVELMKLLEDQANEFHRFCPYYGHEYHFCESKCREDVSSTGCVNFLPADWGYCILVAQGAWHFSWSETLGKRLFYYSWIIAKIFLEKSVQHLRLYVHLNV